MYRMIPAWVRWSVLLSVAALLLLALDRTTTWTVERQESAARLGALRCRTGHVWVRAYPASYCAAGYVPAED